MADKFKLVVIGAGPGGYVAAIRAAQLGIKTAIIEKEYIGGVCLNWGCIPSKALLYLAELKHTIEQCQRIGLKADNVGIDIEKLKKHKEDTVKRLTGGVKILLDKAGVKIFNGQATFISANQIEVTSSDSKTTLEAENFIIATGASTADLPFLRIDGKSVVGAREAIDLPRIPEQLGVIGAGPIGLEMATVYNALGSKVTVIELLGAVLPTLDQDISSASERALTKQGMTIFTSSQVKSAAQKDGKITLEVKTPDGDKSLTFDMVLMSVGMKPNSGGLNLEKVGVKTDKRGFITVDKKMKTSAQNIYAIGDVAGGLLLAHKASHEGIVAAEAIAGGSAEADWKAVPYAVFTDPECAGIGITQQEAVAAGRNIKIGKFPFRAIGKGIATLSTDGFTKVIADAETDEILGIHIFGPHSGDIIYAGTALLEFDGTAEDLGHLMAIHPTLSEALMEAGLNVHKRAIHIVNM
ncbi:MAG TPA: dihydrolipoyl dehydrogenase [candidate division Zixibacteria bacterium]|nr:dihydrolipoyl dehydrogenase [candidate division Zixibacteria bacterium]